MAVTLGVCPPPSVSSDLNIAPKAVTGCTDRSPTAADAIEANRGRFEISC
jgi:hypothetical protein